MPREDRYIRDKFVNRGEQVILDSTAKLARLHQELLPKEAILFAESVELLTSRL